MVQVQVTVMIQGNLGWTGRREMGLGWGRRWGWGQLGGRDRDGAMGRERQGWGKWGEIEVPARAGSWEGEMGRGNLEGKGGNGKGEMGGVNRNGKTVKGQMGGGEEGARGEEILQMDVMKCLGGHMECLGGMKLQSFLTLFTRATPGTPASLY